MTPSVAFARLADMETIPARRLRWGILGTGLIAKEFADGVNASTTGYLVAVGSRTQANADALGAKYGIPHCYGNYDAVLADPEVDAVYISTPHPFHAEWAIKAAEAGKHILVEKPIGLNWHEAAAMIEAAREHDVFLMEAFMYRCHPQIARLRQLLAEGRIGEVKLIRASFAYHAPFDPTSRFYNNDLAGGGILDVGCYPVSLARLVAGAARGKPFEEPLEVKGCGHLGPTGVDEYAVAVLRFPDDIVAELSTGIGLNMHDCQIVEIFGSSGKLTLPNPWIPSRWNRDPVPIVWKRHDTGQTETILVDAPLDLYTYEADEVARYIPQRQSPAMSWADSLGNMRVLDRWRAELGLVYEQEKPANYRHTITRRPLRRRTPVKMPYGHVNGLDKPVSRIVMGAAINNTMPETAILFDDYFERGGNAFDTSYGYGRPNGACEINLGWWIRHRGIRDQVVVIEKGANPPYDTPEGITRELLGGLERLQMDRVDIWLMHRDNPKVPVGEFVDVLNEHWRAGRCTLFGVSNWSLERLLAARDYAQRTGQKFFAALSNQFSLARMIANPWPWHHCLSCNDPAFRQWLAETQMPLFAWSSLARGFFAGAADPETVRCWFSDDNLQRKVRAEELARQRGVDPVAVALAWVLAQPFPTFPIIGPLQVAETHVSLRALDITLTPDEIAWLDLAR